MTELTARGKQVRRDTLRLGIPNGIYHYGGSFSVVEILLALYDHELNDDDKVIMSKGHCWIPQVVILRERGLSPGFGPRLDDTTQSCLVGHPFRDEANGIFANTGSLGHGMPLGVGMAFARKLQKRAGRIYVIVGDGEIQEGTFWESLLLARKYKLDNLTVIIDYNRIQGSGRVADVLPIPLPRSLSRMLIDDMGWEASVVNGHDVPHLIDTLRWPRSMSRPTMIIAETVKGRGVSFMEDRPEWHAKFPTPEQLEQAYLELS